MDHRTDQTGEQHSPTGEATLRALLITMADRLKGEVPGDPMIEAHRLDLARELAGRDTDLRDALLARTVHVAPDATRGEYAGVLLAVADTLDLPARYAAAVQKCRDIAQQVGVKNCDDSAEWRAAEIAANELWTKAREAGHTTATLMATSAIKADG
ncbi:hypothetical protein [Streptomyces aureus]|uniref:hypothetical protein n=1 Tax=Streptomyces aureus TaxID=193461 RepID=UPI0005662F56|nr:hypothetical protein [Streptomyces aureus]